MLPNHVLILGAPHTGKIRIAELISEKRVQSDEKSHSGIIVKTALKTKYYASDLSIMIDEYPEERSEDITGQDKLKGLKRWSAEFLSDECQELRTCIDGFIYTINLDDEEIQDIEKQLDVIERVKSALDEEDKERFFMVVGISESTIAYEEVEDAIISNGMEFIYFNESGVNEYKDKVGKDRLLEILQTHEWTHTSKLSSHDYEESKIKMSNSMTKGLLEDDDDDVDDSIDLGPILQKLRIAKETASGLESENKEEYLKSVIEDVINYI